MTQYPGESRLSVCVLRATGLEAALLPASAAATQGQGLNAYVVCYIYDGRHATDFVQTQIVRKTLAPVFKFKESLSLAISRCDCLRLLTLQLIGHL